MAGGINLQKYYPHLPSLSIGLAYTNLLFNTGMYYLVDPHGMIESHVYDVAEQYTVSIGTDFLVRASAGFTYKSVNSHRYQTTNAGLYDIGFLVDIPVTKIITSASGSPFLKYKWNVNTDKLKGWELGFFDMVMLYGGSFTEDYNHGNRNFLTTGFAFRLSGLLKTLSLLDNDLFESKAMQYVSRNIDVKINYSTITGKNEYYIFSGMKYYSLNLYLMNW